MKLDVRVERNQDDQSKETRRATRTDGVFQRRQTVQTASRVAARRCVVTEWERWEQWDEGEERSMSKSYTLFNSIQIY